MNAIISPESARCGTKLSQIAATANELIDRSPGEL